jgi:hypothetical protein
MRNLPAKIHQHFLAAEKEVVKNKKHKLSQNKGKKNQPKK